MIQLRITIGNILIAGVLLLMLCAGAVSAQDFNIKDFGAVADGKTINTKAIQAAIDQCHQSGGKVVIPKGVYVSGTLYLKSNVELHVEEGGILKGSPYFKDYPDNPVKYKNAFTHNANGTVHASKAFIFAEGVNHISFTGTGTINGSGDSPEFNLGNDDTPKSKLRPCMLLMLDCKNIKVSDLTLTNPAYWLQNYLGCDGLELKRLKIYNQTNYNQDGIDIDAKNVLVEDCKIDVDDDGICFKSHDRNRPVENAIVKNCSISSNCNAIKFGTTSMGGLKNVSITNCTIQKASADRIRHWQQTLQFIDQPVTVISGMALEAVDGAFIQNITISDIKMADVQTPIFIVLGNRGRKQVGDTGRVGSIEHITIKNITAASHSKMASSITAFPGHYVQDVILQNIVFNSMGKGTLQDARTPLKESPNAYPENRMYGQVYPASGLFLRHIKGISLDNVKLAVNNADYRPAIILDDVQGSKISGLNVTAPAGQTAAVDLVNSKNITIERPVFNAAGTPFVQLTGTDEKDLSVVGFNKYKGWLVNH